MASRYDSKSLKFYNKLFRLLKCFMRSVMHIFPNMLKIQVISLCIYKFVIIYEKRGKGWPFIFRFKPINFESILYQMKYVNKYLKIFLFMSQSCCCYIVYKNAPNKSNWIDVSNKNCHAIVWRPMPKLLCIYYICHFRWTHLTWHTLYASSSCQASCTQRRF